MLKKSPEVGSFVTVLKDGIWDDTGEKFQTKGDIHEIVGRSARSGATYFIGDLDSPVYIDDASVEEYELVEESYSKVKMKLIGVEVTAWNYEEDATELSFKFKVLGDSKNTLKAIDNLQEEIIELLKSKYQ